MPYVRNLVYLLILILISPWLVVTALTKGKYRQGFAEKFLGLVAHFPATGIACPRRRIWLHAVSVGEVNLLEPLLQELEQRYPDWEYVISTTTKTGHKLARQKYSRYPIVYCPLDFSWAVKTALRRIKPDLFVLVELELWPNLIHYASKVCPVTIINGRLSESSAKGYKRLGLFIRPTIRKLTHIAVQNQQYADRFEEIGASQQQLTVTGSIKFDGAESNPDNPKTLELRRLAGIADDDIVLLVGSSQVEEEELCLDYFKTHLDTFPQLKLILVPRHPERFNEVAGMCQQTGIPFVRRSAMESGNHANIRLLLIDVIGELGAWWGLTNIAFVGGSLGSRGGQNMIEPAAYGATVSFGPNTWNFKDIVELILQHQAAKVIYSREQFEEFVRWCIESPEQAAAMGQAAAELVADQQGATGKTVDILSYL
ncbi:MAG: 3-deoxy-D-manno-octulosonic acid transferase [Planctomycetaceae bacterium]|nr:3-deoxy-D-manno-octulosonic acid transferase [Planctomycetaceae bacterium]|tara:strand:+ start:3446 stop:4726 length:1281 start_codon:yes stop_codon:yes gene_type:complete